MCQCTSRCIYCGANVHREDCENYLPDRKMAVVRFMEMGVAEVERQGYTGVGHGPGLCCDSCQYCREGVPHALDVCSGAGMKSPSVRSSKERRRQERASAHVNW